MKKRFPNESDKYNEVMLDISNSSVLSESISKWLETQVIGTVNSARRDAANEVPLEECLENEDSMKFYNETKKMFNWDNVLSDDFKDHILNSMLELMEEKHINETKRLDGVRKNDIE